MKQKLRSLAGETLLETMIGLVIIGLVMMCLPMAVTATANINSKVAEQKTIITLQDLQDATATVDLLVAKDNVNAGLVDHSYAIPYSATPLVENDVNVWEQNAVTGHVENQNGRPAFYYYEFSIK